MSRLLTCGYETGDVNEAGLVSTTGANVTVTVVNTTPTPRAGAYCLKVAQTNINSYAWKQFAIGTQTDIWLRFAAYLHGWGPTEGTFIRFTDSAGNDTASVTYSSSDGLLRLRLGAAVAFAAQGTLLATSGVAVTPDTWRLLEVHHQMTSTSAGVTEVWLDGSRVINFSGDNSNAGALANTATIGIGIIGGASATGAYVGVDDLAVNNTSGSVNNARVGDGRIVLLVPSGAGSTTALTRGGTDSGANWSQTSEVPPSMSQYVYSATVATRDTYALGDLPVTPITINAVEVVALAGNSDAGAGSIGLTVKSGATTNEGAAQALTSTAGYIRQLYETDPNTSSAWTGAAVNALEAGPTVR